MSKKIVRATFWQLYAEQVRLRGPLLLSDATLMVLVFLAPAALQVGIKLMVAADARPGFLRAAEIVDGVWLVIAVAIICFDSVGKLLVLALSGWREALNKKHEQGN